MAKISIWRHWNVSTVNLKFEKAPQTKVAYVQLIGRYENWGQGPYGIERLAQKSASEIAGKPIAIFYDNPTETPPAKLRSDACFPIQGDVQPTSKFQIKDLPAGEIAVTRHVGPAEEYTRTYGSFLEGLLKQGHTFYGPAREIFEEVGRDLHPEWGFRYSSE